MFNFRRTLPVLSVLLIGLIVGSGQRTLAQTLSGPALAQANRVADNADLHPRSQVAGHIPAWATPAADAGAVATDAPQLLTFDLARSPEVQAAFDQLLLDQQNLASPRYHQWLTPQQIGDEFGPTQHDLDAFTTWLRGQGFTIASVTPSRIFVQATAPASVVSNALQTSLHTFTVGGNKLQAPLTEPAFPTALAPMVKFVSGLATVQNRTFSTVMKPMPLSALGISAPGSTTPAAHPDLNLTNGAHWLSPADFNLIYDVTPTLNAGITGTGYRVAIIGGSRLTASDLTGWESISALPSYQPTYIVPSGLTDPGYTSDGNQGEGTLDFERVYGTAPGAQIDQVISKNWLSSDTDTLQLYAINTLNDPVLTMSYGACETGYASYAQHENSLFAQAIAQGISVFASSGDTGVAGCEGQGAPPTSQYASIQVPCDSAYLTCVGGTQFSDTASPSSYWGSSNGNGGLSALSYIPEGGWNEPTSTNSAGTTVTNVDASTGGPSITITKPTWQTGANVPVDGVRDVPDVSFSASGHNAYFTCLSYAGTNCPNSITGFGGTSASAPSMAGLAALIDQKLGTRQGLLNPTLYKVAASTPAAFHDATPATSGVSSCTTATPSTCNNSTPSPTSQTGGLAGYPLQVGYDFPTGLGSLDFGKFLAAISLPTPTISVTANPTTITINQTVQFTIKVTASTGTATGTVQLYSNGTAIGSTLTLASGTVTSGPLSFSPAGTYNITAVYSGDTANGPVTGSYSLVVTNPAAIASTSTLAVTPNPATTQQATTLTATVKGSGSAIPTGTVSFFDGGVQKGSPVALSGGMAVLPVGTLSGGTHTFTCTYSGDSVYSASSCAAVTDVVTALSSATVESLSPSTVAAGANFTLGYNVGSTSGGTPTGSVTVYAAQTSPVVSAATAITSLTLANGSVSTSFYNNSPGTFTLYGVYSGDSTYNPSTSQTLTLVITGFSVTSTPGTLSFAAGSATGNAATLNYTPINGFTGTISQSCSISPVGVVAVPIGPTCTVPATVSVSGTGSVTSTVTIGSSASAVGGGVQQIGAYRVGTLGGISLAGLLLLIMPTRRRMLRSWRGLALVAFLSVTLFTLAGCGSGSVGKVVTGTTRGAYSLVVTSTAGGETTQTTTTITIQ